MKNKRNEEDQSYRRDIFVPVLIKNQILHTYGWEPQSVLCFYMQFLKKTSTKWTETKKRHSIIFV